MFGTEFSKKLYKTFIVFIVFQTHYIALTY